jgi:heme exporter protein D
MRTFDIYLILFLVNIGYAAILEWFKHLWEPELTALEVVIGVALCLAAPFADRLLNGPYTAEVYEGRVWLAFVVGGLPVIIWWIGRNVRAWRRILERIYGKSSAAALASERRGRAETDD